MKTEEENWFNPIICRNTEKKTYNQKSEKIKKKRERNIGLKKKKNDENTDYQKNEDKKKMSMKI